MLTENQKKDLNNFKQAKEIALTIQCNCWRRASGDLENPFWGANINEQPMVLWEESDSHLTECVVDGKVFVKNKVFNFRKVDSFTILEGKR